MANFIATFLKLTMSELKIVDSIYSHFFFYFHFYLIFLFWT